jgi:hypothetical protein
MTQKSRIEQAGSEVKDLLPILYSDKNSHACLNQNERFLITRKKTVNHPPKNAS